MQIRRYLGGVLSHSGHSRLDGGLSTTPGRASDIHSLPGCKEDTPAQWGAVVAHTSRDLPSVTALPPDEGVELADVDSAQDEQSMSRHRESIHASMLSEGGRSSPLTGSVAPPAIPFATTAIKMDNTSVIHPFFPQMMRDPFG